MSGDDIRRIAVTLVAIFSAHTLAVLLTAPMEPARRPRPRRHAVALTKATHRAAGVQPAHRDVTVATDPHDGPWERKVRVSAPIGRAEDLDLSAYHGLGSWIDLFDTGPWKNPSATVARADRRGVKTIYLQTATYGSPRHIVYRDEVDEFITAAHRRDIKVVGWSVPAFTQWRKDFRRAKAALVFRTTDGDRFDSFALDIEAAIIKNISTRNKRLIKISDKLRRVAGSNYTLGAIIPDTHSNYWPSFPYRELAQLYDVMVPMGYFTFRTRNYRGVRRYTTANIKVIRKEAGKEMPIHVIGGIADDVGVSAARGFVKAVKKHRVLGASLYDFPITSKETWKELSSVSGPPEESPTRDDEREPTTASHPIPKPEPQGRPQD